MAKFSPQQIKKGAIVAFFNKDTWGIIGKYWSVSGVHHLSKMPEVDCITFDMTEVNREELESSLPWFPSKFDKLVTPRGVTNMKKLKKLLKKHGAKIIKPKKK